MREALRPDGREALSEAGDAAHLLAPMKDRRITLPANPTHWPAQRHLEWHRSHTFLGRQA